MAQANRRRRFALLHRACEPAHSRVLARWRPRRPRLLVRGPQEFPGDRRLPAEIVYREGAEAFSESARASSSCRGWWRLHARFVFERAENAATRSGERSATDG